MKAALPVGAVALLIYLRTIAPGVTEIDSGELAAVAATLGIAHPSGYPLFSVLGRAWTLLHGELRVITWMNALSAGLAAAAVLLLCRVVFDLLPDRSAAARRAGAWTAALAVAFHATFWSVAVVTEVHALQMFLDAALLHAVVRSGLWGRRPFRESAFLAAGYFAGLCLTNHLTSALLLPGVALGAWRRRREIRPRVLVGAAGLGLLGASVYLFLPLRSAQGPYLDWGSPETWDALRRHVTGAQYQVWMFTSGETFGRNLGELAARLAGFSWPLLVLAPLGLWRARRVPGLLAGSLAMGVAAAAYPLGYAIHDIATYFLPTLLIVAIWIGLGAAQFVEFVARSAPGRALLPMSCLLVACVVPVPGRWKEVDRSRDTFIEEMARSFLATPAESSVVVTAYWDAFMSAALYLQRVEGVRPDLVVLDQEHFRRSWNVPWLRRHHAEMLAGLEEEADRMQEQVLRFERDRPYDRAEIQSAFETLINGILENGVKRGGAAYVSQEVEAGIGRSRVRVPDGLLFRLDSPFEKARLGPPPPWPRLPPRTGPDRWEDQARGYAARMATLAAGAAVRLGDPDRARKELRRALDWNPDDPLARRQQAALEAAGE